MIEEPGSAELAERVAGRSLVSSELTRIEVERAIMRSAPGSDLGRRVLRRVTLQHIDANVVARAASLGPPELRSLDAIHLATALLFASELDAFITYDRQLGRAAATAGLTVEAPR